MVQDNEIILYLNFQDKLTFLYLRSWPRSCLQDNRLGNDLKSYTIGNHILNRSFLSTSKNRSVAQLFTGNNQGNQNQISVLIKYTIKQNQTAIDIEHLSTIQDEKEVLILPFAVFQVKDRIENNPQMSPPVLVEIDLEECENNEQINYKKQKSKQFIEESW